MLPECFLLQYSEESEGGKIMNLVEMSWVHEHLNDPRVLLVDCRFTLGSPEAGEKAYRQEHLPGAFYLDLEKDLSGKIQQHGGRHPLPDPEDLAKTLSAIGVDENIHVIAYDDQGGCMAARCWWLLTYLGHPKVSVMNGTFQLWNERGYPVTAEVPSPTPRSFKPHIIAEMAADQDEVKQKMNRQDTLLIDSRELNRYLGLEEPIDPVAGHIPGAVNFFWKDVLRPDGQWKSKEELKHHFSSLPKDKEMIVYCGSGVTATPNVLALKEAGFTRVKLYPGSWSDWISHKENPIATGPEKGNG
jgi:thiosulfate/3-mercaptopyruvate sulfurtransferase